MTRYFFGYESNGRTCDKGCHYGIGDISPQERAARAARMRDTMPELMPNDMRAFLTDWEKYHGAARYSMGVIGNYTGTLEGYKHMKGQPLKGAIYQDNAFQPHRRIYAE